MQNVFFYDPKAEHGYLSNFHKEKKPLIIGGEIWSDTEQYFQAVKYRGPKATKEMLKYSDIIKEADTPGKVKMLGAQRQDKRFGKLWKINKKTDERLVNDVVEEYKHLKYRDDWSSARVATMINALYAKFTQYSHLRKKLEAFPDNTYLIEHTTRDKIWGDGGDEGSGVVGSNYLGKILTALSYILKHGDCKGMLPELKEKIRIRTGPELEKSAVEKSKAKKISGDTMKIVSWNVNGIRSRVISNKNAKDCKKWCEIEEGSNLGKIIEDHDPDIICFQETKCDHKTHKCYDIPGFYQYWSESKLSQRGRLGSQYSGVSIWSKTEPIKVIHNIPTLPEEDQEGRVIVAYFKEFVLINTYSPNSGTNFEYRTKIWDISMKEYLAQLRDEGRKVIWCGDLNVSHKETDVFFTDTTSYRYNKAASLGVGSRAIAGFTKEERQNFSDILAEGYVDTYRELHPDTPKAFTWWNTRVPTDRRTNHGMRLDYFVVSDSTMPCVQASEILLDSGLVTDMASSDHAAVLLILDENCLE
jgi:exodeoxyribonuclease III